MRANAGDGDDRPFAFAFEEQRQERSSDMIDSPNVDVPDVPPVVRVAVRYGCVLPDIASIVDDDVQPSEGFLHLSSSGNDLIVVCDIKAEREDNEWVIRTLDGLTCFDDRIQIRTSK